MPEGRGLAEVERERSQPPALRAASFQRKEGKVVRNLSSAFPVEGKAVKNHLPPSRGRGMPEGQGVGRRRKRAKPTSGATRHLLPEEGGRVVRNLSPFLWEGEAVKTIYSLPMEGGCPKGRGLAEDERE